MAFETTHILRMNESDAAGILFYANQFVIMHQAYEDLLKDSRFGLGGFSELLDHKKYFVPIVHANADFLAPLHVGDPLRIVISLGRLGSSSYTLQYELFRTATQAELVGRGQTVHVSIDSTSWTKIPLPTTLKDALQKI